MNPYFNGNPKYKIISSVYEFSNISSYVVKLCVVSGYFMMGTQTDKIYFYACSCGTGYGALKDKAVY